MYKNKPVFPSPLLFAAILMLFLPACSSTPTEPIFTSPRMNPLNCRRCTQILPPVFRKMTSW